VELRVVNLEWAQEIARKNVVATYLDTARGAPGCAVNQEDGFTWAEANGEASFANMLVDFYTPNNFAEFVKAIERTKLSKFSPRAFVMEGDSFPRIDEILLKSGYRESQTQTIWCFDVQSELGNHKLIDSVELCETLDSKNDAVDLMLNEFFTSRSNAYRKMVKDATLFAGSRFYCCKKDGQVIGVSMMKLAEDSGGIYNLCVHPLYRRFGYGSAILSRMIQDCREENLLPTLQCDELLSIYYRRQNFINTGKLRSFVALRQKLR